MAAKSKRISLYLLNGSSTGAIVAEIDGWTGKLFVFSKQDLEWIVQREEFSHAGVYVLLGSDTNNPEIQRIYIGETEVLSNRLKQHRKADTKVFWDRTVVLTSKDESLNKAHIKYLESQMVSQALTANVVIVENNQVPPSSKLSEYDKGYADDFWELSLLILTLVGLNVWHASPSLAQKVGEYAVNVEENNLGKYVNPIFSMTTVGVSATARQIGEFFVVSAGSTARISSGISLGMYADLKKALIEERILALDDSSQVYKFMMDAAFSSMTAAASVVAGTARNGGNTWMIKGTNITYSAWADDLRAKVAHAKYQQGIVIWNTRSK